MKLEDKKEIIEKLHAKLTKSKVVIVTDYKGLDVAAISELRKQLRAVGVEYQVVKNTFLTRASENTEVAAIQDFFKGPSAVAYSLTDPVTPAKVLTRFAEDHDKLQIKAGVLRGKRLDLNDIKALSALPSREILLGQVLSTMLAVPTSFVRALNDVPRRLLNVLQAVKEKKEAALSEPDGGI